MLEVIGMVIFLVGVLPHIAQTYGTVEPIEEHNRQSGVRHDHPHHLAIVLRHAMVLLHRLQLERVQYP